MPFWGVNKNCYYFSTSANFAVFPWSLQRLNQAPGSATVAYKSFPLPRPDDAGDVERLRPQSALLPPVSLRPCLFPLRVLQTLQPTPGAARASVPSQRHLALASLLLSAVPSLSLWSRPVCGKASLSLPARACLSFALASEGASGGHRALGWQVLAFTAVTLSPRRLRRFC